MKQKFKIKKYVRRNPGVQSKPILQFDLEGKFIAEYKSQTEAAKATGIQQAWISQALSKKNTKVKSTKGFQWKLKEELTKKK